MEDKYIFLFISVMSIMYFGSLITMEYFRTRITKEELPEIPVQQMPEYPVLEFEKLNKIIDSIVEEVYTNKYLLYYRLREVKIIKHMDKEILDITSEIYESFSPTIVYNIKIYYGEEYFIKKLTRTVQMYLVEYTDKHKPKTK